MQQLVVLSAAAALSAPVTEWPSLGGTTGFHRMNGKVKPTRPALAQSGAVVQSWYDAGTRLVTPLELKARELKSQGQAVVDRRAEIAAKFETALIAKDPIFVDEAALVAAQGFPLTEAELITKAKEFLFFGQGVERPSL